MVLIGSHTMTKLYRCIYILYIDVEYNTHLSMEVMATHESLESIHITHKKLRFNEDVLGTVLATLLA